MEKRIIGYYEEDNLAEKSANELRAQGFTEISVLSNDKRQGGDDKQDLTNGTVAGGALGGLAGLALGAGALFIPGVGPLVAMGPLAATIGGAVTGGVAGALVDYGIPAGRSDFYESKIKEGNTVMVIKADESKSNTVADTMRNNGAKDVRVH